MKKVLAILAIVTCTFAAQAQTKIGHVNRTELFQLMPQVDSIKQNLASETNVWQSMLTSKENEIRDKYAKLVEEEPTLNQEQLQVRSKELEDLQTSYSELQQRANQALKNSENEQLAPVFKLMDEAITAVAKEKGFDYVVDSSEGGGIIYSNESLDLLPLVKTKLSIK
jgi:outer membrane protein